MPLILIPFIAGAIGILYSIWLIKKVLAKPKGDGKMVLIACAIETGAKAYLKRQYQTIAFIGIAVFALLLIFLGVKTALGFLVGAVLSGASGVIGMLISVKANVRTAEAAKTGLREALDVALKGGTVTGLLVVSLALLGVGLLTVSIPLIIIGGLGLMASAMALGGVVAAVTASLTIIGGLIVSTIITLVLIPAAYYLIFKNKKKAIPVEMIKIIAYQRVSRNARVCCKSASFFKYIADTAHGMNQF